jgi:hypothetical protein
VPEANVTGWHERTCGSRRHEEANRQDEAGFQIIFVVFAGICRVVANEQ